MNRTLIMAAVIAAGAGIVLTVIYMHGEARCDACYSKAREEGSTQAAEAAKEHATKLAAAIEKTRQQENAFHAKLSKLQTVKDVTGCLDTPLREFTDRLRDTYPDQRRPSGGPMRPGPITRWSGNATADR